MGTQSGVGAQQYLFRIRWTARQLSSFPAPYHRRRTLQAVKTWTTLTGWDYPSKVCAVRFSLISLKVLEGNQSPFYPIKVLKYMFFCTIFGIKDNTTSKYVLLVF